jgi:hypothetical protein
MTTREKIIAAIEANPGATRSELLEITGLPGSKFDPERLRLWLRGEIEPVTEQDWRLALKRSFVDVRWHRTEPDRREEVAARAGARTERNAESSPEQKAKEIVEQLADPTVNRLVLQMTKDGPGSRRAQRRAEDALRRRHMEVRQEAAQAKREKSRRADFLSILRHLWDARGAVNAVHVHLIEERARVATGEEPRIPLADWLTAARDVRKILENMGVAWQNVRDLENPNAPCPACGAPQIGEHLHLGAFSLADVDVDAGDVEELGVADVASTQ